MIENYMQRFKISLSDIMLLTYNNIMNWTELRRNDGCFIACQPQSKKITYVLSQCLILKPLCFLLVIFL